MNFTDSVYLVGGDDICKVLLGEVDAKMRGAVSLKMNIKAYETRILFRRKY